MPERLGAHDAPQRHLHSPKGVRPMADAVQAHLRVENGRLREDIIDALREITGQHALSAIAPIRDRPESSEVSASRFRTRIRTRLVRSSQSQSPAM